MSERVRSERSALRHGAVLSASCFIADTLRDFCRGNRRVGITSLGLRSKGTCSLHVACIHHHHRRHHRHARNWSL